MLKVWIMSKKDVLWSQINHGALIAGLKVQMGDNFAHCDGQFTLCCTWQNMLPHWHTDASEWNHQRPSFISTLASRGLQANRHGINWRVTDIGNDGKVENVLKYFMVMLLHLLGWRFWIYGSKAISRGCTTPLGVHQCKAIIQPKQRKSTKIRVVGQ